ncbi:N-acetylmuramoyl-L-alanine amidase [Novosphingobium sp.]|uniref:N-acetylmuramoyl-L-alanine amidase family protein n=1 Tax=Novosphingobium sp. TaxID=1874826 RepID=UPI002732F157|nr:N-acetylmuramoyl-L-alanine amidase [Novosphingobium sp.]MDP3906073.1 N-acetylmuramoyl-L-alanine amidase [Novosphingobium sp.]
MQRALFLVLIFIAPVAVFAGMVTVDRIYGAPGRGWDYVVTVLLPPTDNGGNLPQILGPADASRPLVVIDAGHGGRDPGAGAGAVKEKQLTLAMAIALRDELLRGGGVRVALTRDDDRFLVLSDRYNIARRLGADLFISIHADSTETGTGARGATVYTLSDRGSNETAERMAARENAADEVNGIRLEAQTDAVNATLVDLSQRLANSRSEELASLILREGEGRLPFRERTGQSGAFVVLKSPDVPSVLFESGYINNPEDLARLNSVAGRTAIAEVLGKAIRVYFARQAVPQIGT